MTPATTRRPQPPAPTVRVGLLGLGTVGGAVLRALLERGDAIAGRTGARVEVVRMAVAHLDKPRPAWVDRSRLTADGWAVVGDRSIDVVVEAIGGIEPARSFLLHALRAGTHVVTVNKHLVAAHGPALREAAARSGAALRWEGSVGAGVPVLGALRTGLSGSRIRRVVAAINGTSNAVLSAVGRGRSFAEALADARAAGLAEADPGDDLDGHDSAAKLAILVREAFGIEVPPAAIPRQGIRDLAATDLQAAAALGCTIRLVASAGLDGEAVAAAVRPRLIPGAHPLASLDGAEVGVVLDGDLAGSICLRGPGAGGPPTAGAVLGDLMAILERGAAASWAPSRPPQARPRLRPARAPLGPHYVRLRMRDPWLRPSLRDGVIDALVRAGDAWAMLVSGLTAPALLTGLRRLPDVLELGRPLPVEAV